MIEKKDCTSKRRNFENQECPKLYWTWWNDLLWISSCCSRYFSRWTRIVECFIQIHPITKKKNLLNSNRCFLIKIRFFLKAFLLHREQCGRFQLEVIYFSSAYIMIYAVMIDFSHLQEFQWKCYWKNFLTEISGVNNWVNE